VGLFFEPGDESACLLQGHLVVVDAKEQEETVTRRPLVRTHQGWMLVRAPLVEAEQDGSIGIQDLTKVIMARRRLGLAEKRLVPLKAAGNVPYANDRPCAFHRSSNQAKLCGTTLRQMQTSTQQFSILQPRLAASAPECQGYPTTR
jgi:hypothetical protein